MQPAGRQLLQAGETIYTITDIQAQTSAQLATFAQLLALDCKNGTFAVGPWLSCASSVRLCTCA